MWRMYVILEMRTGKRTRREGNGKVGKEQNKRKGDIWKAYIMEETKVYVLMRPGSVQEDYG